MPPQVPEPRRLYRHIAGQIRVLISGVEYVPRAAPAHALRKGMERS